MEPRDVSKQIAEIAQNYFFAKQPEFVRSALEWLAKGLRWIADFLHELFRTDHNSVDSQAMSSAMQVAVWVIGIAGVLVMIWALVHRARNFNKDTQLKTVGAVEVEELQDANGWKRQAERLATQNDYKGACRALYLSLLQCMHERGVAEFAPARTNYEYSYTLARYPEVQKDFRRMAERVERIWFGNREASGSDYGEAMSDLDALNERLQLIERAQLSQEQQK
jgi:hypothetical protein